MWKVIIVYFYCVYFVVSHIFLFPATHEEDEKKEFTLSSHILALWEKRSKNLIHDYAVAGWAFSVQLEICSYCINLLTGAQRLQIEQIVVKLH